MGYYTRSQQLIDVLILISFAPWRVSRSVRKDKFAIYS